MDGAPRTEPNSKGVLITQQGSVFPWLTVRQNLLFGLPDELPNREALAQEYAELVGLQGFENNYPHELSGGMLKRAEIARALVVKPEILYMDEPFSALDALMSLRMQNELLRILAKERHTVMLITHDVEEAIHLADRILVLSPRPARIQASFIVPLAASAARVEPGSAGAAGGHPAGAGGHGDRLRRRRLTTVAAGRRGGRGCPAKTTTVPPPLTFCLVGRCSAGHAYVFADLWD